MHVAEFSELCHLSVGERTILLSISREIPLDWLARTRFRKIIFHALLRNFPGLSKSTKLAETSLTLTVSTGSQRFSRTSQTLLHGTARLMLHYDAPRMPPHLGTTHTAALWSHR